MLFRAFVIKSAAELRQFTLDAQSSSGYQRSTNFGSAPLSGADMKPAAAKKAATGTTSTSKKKKAKKLYKPVNPSFGQQNLIDWLDSIEYPY